MKLIADSTDEKMQKIFGKNLNIIFRTLRMYFKIVWNIKLMNVYWILYVLPEYRIQRSHFCPICTLEEEHQIVLPQKYIITDTADSKAKFHFSDLVVKLMA